MEPEEEEPERGELVSRESEKSAASSDLLRGLGGGECVVVVAIFAALLRVQWILLCMVQHWPNNSLRKQSNLIVVPSGSG